MPASDRCGLGQSQGTPELCPSTSVAETTIAAAVAAYDRANPKARCRATPHSYWPSCFRLRMCANEACRTLLQKGSAEIGFLPC